VNFRVSVAHEAEKILDRLDRPTEQRVRARFVQLAVDPFDSRLSAPLADRPGIRKSRVGAWLVLFTVDLEAQAIYILTVDTRGQVYKHS
jgi:mRNA interferase RelE/StbE